MAAPFPGYLNCSSLGLSSWVFGLGRGTAVPLDTKGQTCYICTQALHWKTKEGLVRGCACRGTAGFAHVSCLAEQATILVADAEENVREGAL